jgi:hypothetical protein
MPAVLVVVIADIAFAQSTAGSSCGISCGDRIVVINSANIHLDQLHVREAHGVPDPDDHEVGICDHVWNGATGRVLTASVDDDSYTWWYILWDDGWASGCNGDGWSAEAGYENGIWTCWLQVESSGCCSNSDCADGDPCTTDACTNFTCQHSGTCSGACCFADGDCSILTQSNCEAQGGNNWYANQSCASVNCSLPPSTGACCIGNNCYTDYTHAACQNQGGDWQGAGSTSCTDCPPLPSRYALTVQANPASAGSVSRSPAPDADGKYAAGTQVQLTAWPNTTYTFLSWSGDATGSNYTTTVTMNGNRSVTANFGDAREGILAVEPRTDFVTSAETAHGPYVPPSMIYILKNMGGRPLDWVISNGEPEGLPPWLDISPTSGTIEPLRQERVTITVVPAEVASSLCRYRSRLAFTNTTTGQRDEVRNVELTVRFICNAASGGQSVQASIPDALAKIIIWAFRLWHWDGTAFLAYEDLVPIDLTQPTFILAHGWDGNPWIWIPTARKLRAIPQYSEANILAWEWEVDANPNHRNDFDSFFTIRESLIAWEALKTRAIEHLPFAMDAFEANKRAEAQGNLLAQKINEYPSLGTELHLIGKSLGGGLLAQAATALKGRLPIDSLTMIDAPKAWGVDAMQNLDPSSAERTLVFYYDTFLRCGFGAPAAYPAINLRMDPDLINGDFCIHEHITDEGAWFPELIGDRLTLDGKPRAFPQHLSSLDRCRLWGETGEHYNFEPTGACLTFGLFGYERCNERFERDCVSAPAAPRVWAGAHTRCSEGDSACPAKVVAGTHEQSKQVAIVDQSAQDRFPGMVPVLTLPMDSAAEWQGDKSVVATGLDPGDVANSVVFLQEDGDASFYRDFL